VIGRQTARGSLLMVGARLLMRVIDLITMLVLARLLDPGDFGLVAIATSAVVIVESALELPVNQALLRLTVVTPAHFDTAFTLAALRVTLLVSIILIGAGPFARFYDDPRLFALVCVLAVGAGARGLASPCITEFQKAMSFWRDFVIQMTGKVLGFAVGTATAVATHSYWSIAAGAIAYPVVAVVGSYCFAPYRPRFGLTEMPAFAGFVGWITAGEMISALTWQSERLFLGKLQDKAALGLFSTASDLSLIPLLALFGPIILPLLAAFSLVRHDKARLSRSYQQASAAIMTFGLPLLVGESLLAEPAIRVVLGEAWLGAAPLLRWLSLSMIPGLFALAANPLVMAAGETKIFLKRNTLEFCVKLPFLIVGGITYGFAGVALARAASEIAGTLYCVHAVRRLTGLSLGAQLLGPWRSFVATLVMAPVVIACARCLVPAQGGWAGGWQGALDLAAVIAVGGATYAAAIGCLWLVSGRPQGVEAMAVDTLFAMITKARRPA
jgi:PST family polysaccharide transporter